MSDRLRVLKNSLTLRKKMACEPAALVARMKNLTATAVEQAAHLQRLLDAIHTGRCALVLGVTLFLCFALPSFALLCLALLCSAFFFFFFFFFKLDGFHQGTTRQRQRRRGSSHFSTATALKLLLRS